VISGLKKSDKVPLMQCIQHVEQWMRQSTFAGGDSDPLARDLTSVLEAAKALALMEQNEQTLRELGYEGDDQYE
jgi:hypothetical protein